MHIKKEGWTYQLKEIYSAKCNKSIKFVNPKVSYILDKTLVLPIMCSTCGDHNHRIIKEKESIN